jgi:predicted membrane protein
METHCTNKTHTMKRVVFGLMVITAGILWMLRNMGMIDDDTASIIFHWPMLLIAIGFISLFGDSKIFGVIMMLVGGFYLTSQVYEIPVEFRQVFWPTLIIVGGILILLRPGHRFHKRFQRQTSSNDIIDEMNIFGGGEIRVNSLQFQGGKLSAVFGGSNIILLDSELAEGNNILEISVIFGGFKLIIPAHWNVKIETSNVFGGIVDKRIVNDNYDISRTLIIKGSAIFGGGEITSILD